jgi:hypothetical protein
MAFKYQYATLAQVLQEISNRLYDPNAIFWPQAELQLYINESLSVFNSLAWFWRGDFQFTLNPNQIFYDLTQLPNTLRPYTVTDVDLYNLIEVHLLEPATGATWTGTAQFTIDDLLNAVQRRWNEILSVTGCTVTQSTIPAVANQTRNTVADNVLDIRRIAYFNPTGGGGDGYGQGGFGGGGFGGQGPYGPLGQYFSNVLWPEDTWAFQSFETVWTTQPQGVPQMYAQSSEPPLSFDTDKPPNQNGLYELITVNAGSQLTTTAPTLINIPQDFCWILKYGALADLFSKESEAQDLPRAQYCNARYQQGLILLANSPALFQFRINNQPIWIDSLRTTDEYNNTWEGQFTSGFSYPNLILQSGLNLIAATPYSLSTPIGATATVLQNAPLPVLMTDFVQIPRDCYDVFIDYCVNLAMLKCGGAEALSSDYLYKRLVKMCSAMNSKLGEMGCFNDAITAQSNQEEVFNPRMRMVQNG